jgi:hypothetical protein
VLGAWPMKAERSLCHWGADIASVEELTPQDAGSRGYMTCHFFTSATAFTGLLVYVLACSRPSLSHLVITQLQSIDTFLSADLVCNSFGRDLPHLFAEGSMHTCSPSVVVAAKGARHLHVPIASSF